MIKKFIIFPALVFYIALVPLFAHAKNNASDMPAGEWMTNPRYITFGEYNGHPLVWRVLEVKENDSDFDGIKTAFLLLDDLLKDGDGNTELRKLGSSNSFPISEIKEWLNDSENGFLSNLSNYQYDMLDTTYGPDNGSRRWSGGIINGASKVFLLSVAEANNSNYFANNADRTVGNNAWWLRSPGFSADITAIVLNAGGIARNGFFVEHICAVRPAVKISLSLPSIFATIPVSYGLTVGTYDGAAPISGVKVSLTSTSSALAVESFSNSVGMARFPNIAPGTYALKFSKPGYEMKSEIITVLRAATPAISLTPDQTVLPGRVKFGKYEGIPIEWDVLDIVNDKALLFTGALFQMNFDMEGSVIWENSSLRAFLNGDNTGDFLHVDNFTAAEAAAINATVSATGDSVFLLSSDEAYKYLTDAYMRSLNDREWITRTPYGDEDVEIIRSDGEYGGGIPAFTRDILGWIRPAMWVDLSALTYDRETNTLLRDNK